MHFFHRSLKPGTTLPFLQMKVTETGVELASTKQNMNKNFDSGPFAIDCISYGVQDLVYTRVFAMIVVRDAVPSSPGGNEAANSMANYRNPFECYAFVCDSRSVCIKDNSVCNFYLSYNFH